MCNGLWEKMHYCGRELGCLAMRFLRIWPFMLPILVSACEKRTYERPNPQNSYLETPNGKYAFRNITSAELSKIDRRLATHLPQHSYLLAEGPSTKVLFSTGGTLKIGTNNLNPFFRSVVAATEYKHAGESSEAFSTSVDEYNINLKHLWYYNREVNASSQDVFRSLVFNIPNTNISESPHSLDIPFLINGEAYRIRMLLLVEPLTVSEFKLRIAGTP